MEILNKNLSVYRDEADNYFTDGDINRAALYARDLILSGTSQAKALDEASKKYKVPVKAIPILIKIDP